MQKHVIKAVSEKFDLKNNAWILIMTPFIYLDIRNKPWYITPLVTVYIIINI